jgi:hypothetical protein
MYNPHIHSRDENGKVTPYRYAFMPIDVELN